MAQDEISFTDFIASSISDMKNSLNIQVNALERIAVERRQQGDQSTFESLGLVIYQANRMNVNLIQLLTRYKLGRAIYPVDFAEQSVSEMIHEALLQDGVSANKGVSFSVGSTGLGLFFSSQVAGLHKNGHRQGTLTIENGGTYGGGCFVVRLS